MGNTTIQARRNEKNSWGWREAGGGGGGSLYKNVGQIGQLTKKIVQLKRFKMPRNT